MLDLTLYCMEVKMNKADHRQRHIDLHRNLDELLNDAIQYGGLLPSKATVLDLLRWSFEQTVAPTPIMDKQEIHE